MSDSILRFLPPAILLLDLETTGLDPRAEGAAILEVWARLYTPGHPGLIEGPEYHAFLQADYGVCKWPAAVQVMHTQSGLVREWKGLLARQPPDAVAADLIQLLSDHKGAVLMGSSIHTDRAWIEVHMPRLAEWLGYRLIDASTITQLAAIAGCEFDVPQSGHRARGDAERSLAIVEWALGLLAKERGRQQGI